MGPKLSVSERVAEDCEDVVDRAMNVVRYADRCWNQPMPAPPGMRTFILQRWRMACARIISCGSDPAVRLRHPRSALRARPGFRPQKREQLREPSGPRMRAQQ